MRKISILYTVYNQADIMKRNLDALSKLDSDSFELVVSDDCSTEDIQSLVESYNDTRFKYYRNPQNLGHDLNILQGFRRCENNFVYLFRSKDHIIPEAIESILDLISENGNAGFILCSALDEDGRPRLKFKDKCYKRGEESANAHYKLPLHPSGNIYNKKFMDLDLYEKYIKNYFSHIFAFTVHQIIRADLARKSDIIVSSIYGWVYQHTISRDIKKMGIAVNSTKNGTNVYAPELLAQRFNCQLNFILNEFDNDIKMTFILNLTKRMYVEIGYFSLVVCEDPFYAFHYNCKVRKYSVFYSTRLLNDLSCKLLDKLEGDIYETGKKKLKHTMFYMKFKVMTYYNCRRLVVRFVKKLPVPFLNFIERALDFVRISMTNLR